jgi:hypothetical protein
VNTKSVNTVETTVQEHIRIVLNGGGKIMESATIPIQWFISEELAEREPTHVLIIEYLDSEYKGMMECTGRRYLCEITDMVKFIQLFSAGIHNIVVCVLRLENGEIKYNSSRLNLRNGPFYNTDVNYKQILDESQLTDGHTWPYIIAATSVEIEVPSELFAHKPQSKVGKWFWQWVNLMHTEAPRDECKFRARIMWAFTGQIVVALAYLTIHLVVATIASLSAIIGRCLVLFCGYRPSSLIEPLRTFWTSNIDEWRSVERRFWTKYRHYDYTLKLEETYRVWKWDGSGNHTYMLFTGIDLIKWCVPSILVSWSIVGIALLFKHLPFNWLLVGKYSLIISSIIGTSVITYRLCKGKHWFQAILCKIINTLDKVLTRTSTLLGPLNNYLQERQKIKLAKEQKGQESSKQNMKDVRRQERLKWLSSEINLRNAPEKVDLHLLPRPLEQSLENSLRLRFWATKAKVCRPFAKE